MLKNLANQVYFYLYLFLDILSRKIVGGQVYEAESSERAGEREHILPNQGGLHSDNGSPMKGALLRANLFHFQIESALIIHDQLVIPFVRPKDFSKSASANSR